VGCATYLAVNAGRSSKINYIKDYSHKHGQASEGVNLSGFLFSPRTHGGLGELKKKASDYAPISSSDGGDVPE